jgi:hypothetical protein
MTAPWSGAQTRKKKKETRAHLSPSVGQEHRRQDLEHRQPSKCNFFMMVDNVPQCDSVLMNQLRQDLNCTAVD